MRQHLPLRARGQADAGRGCEPSWKSPVRLHRGFQQPQVGGVVQGVCMLRGIHEIRRFPTVGKAPRTRAGRITEWAVHDHVNQSVKYALILTTAMSGSWPPASRKPKSKYTPLWSGGTRTCGHSSGTPMWRSTPFTAWDFSGWAALDAPWRGKSVTENSKSGRPSRGSIEPPLTKCSIDDGQRVN